MLASYFPKRNMPALTKRVGVSFSLSNADPDPNPNCPFNRPDLTPLSLPSNPILPPQRFNHTLQHPLPHNRRYRIPNLFLRPHLPKNMLNRKALQCGKLPDCKIPFSARMDLTATVAGDGSCDLVSPPWKLVTDFAFVWLVVGSAVGN